MMLWGLLLLGLVSGTLGHTACCSAEDRREVQRAWEELWGAQYTGRRVAIGLEVFKDLFEHHPEYKELFERFKVSEGLDNPEFKAHVIRVMSGLDLAINLLDDPVTLDLELDHLSAQHQARKGVTAAQFDSIQESLNRLLPHVSSCFNPDAWNRCFNRIKNGITHGLP